MLHIGQAIKLGGRMERESGIVFRARKFWILSLVMRLGMFAFGTGIGRRGGCKEMQETQIYR